jgi:hypothetical protein
MKPMPRIAASINRNSSMRRRRQILFGMANCGLVVCAMLAPQYRTSGPAVLPATFARPIGTARAAGRPGAGIPHIKLIAAERNITTSSYGGVVRLDPAVWVASLRSALEFQVRRHDYGGSVTLTQVIHESNGAIRTRRLPAWADDGFYGLRDFLRVRIVNPHGTTVVNRLTSFCPNTSAPERTSPASASISPYPSECGTDPFPLGLVMGIAQGWAVDPFQSQPQTYRLKPDQYWVDVQIPYRFAQLLGISRADSAARVHVLVKKAETTSAGTRRDGPPPHRSLASLPRVPLLRHVPRADRPDLIALPSWGISTEYAQHQDLLVFGATVWVGGGSPLDVEGFRSNTSPVMRAYQYFWHHGKLIGRVRAGTMGFYDQKWRFAQFARYQLLTASRELAVRSHKEGFCIAPTDPVNLLLRDATWQPSEVGLSGQCGTPSALWTREYLPVGWGDTYTQFVEGEAFNITNLPNGTYYIEIIANPEHVLLEQSTTNDVSLREVILGGTQSHRTVKVPAWHGIDPEH